MVVSSYDRRFKCQAKRGMSGRPTPSSINSAAVGALFVRRACKGMSDRMFDGLMSHALCDIHVAV